MQSCKICDQPTTSKYGICPLCAMGGKKPAGKIFLGRSKPQLIIEIVGFCIALYLMITVISWFEGLGGNEPDLTPRQESIQNQFSAWDGSHVNLERVVKSQMLDPDSFEHVQTNYADDGESIRVRMVYRGSNAFGATVTSIVVARASINGDILEIIEQ